MSSSSRFGRSPCFHLQGQGAGNCSSNDTALNPIRLESWRESPTNVFVVFIWCLFCGTGGGGSMHANYWYCYVKHDSLFCRYPSWFIIHFRVLQNVCNRISSLNKPRSNQFALVFWVVTHCSIVGGCRCFGETCCLDLQGIMKISVYYYHHYPNH